METLALKQNEDDDAKEKFHSFIWKSEFCTKETNLCIRAKCKENKKVNFDNAEIRIECDDQSGFGATFLIFWDKKPLEVDQKLHHHIRGGESLTSSITHQNLHH